MRILQQLNATVMSQQGYLFPWVPVFLAVGISGYFALPHEPGLVAYTLLSCIALIAITFAVRWPGVWSPLAWAIALSLSGLIWAGVRSHAVATPSLTWRYYGPIEGRVVAMDRSASDAKRITLDQVRLNRVAFDKVPERVRISLHGGAVEVAPGQRVMTTGHISPPQGPVEPGGFDFRRYAWFKQLGGVGYSRTPVLTVGPINEPSGALRVLQIRMAISEHVRNRLSGDIGGFAAAITAGDRSSITQQTLANLRTSNLAHLLAISGLHMGLLAGFIFSTLRIGISLFPPLALRIPVKKIAACGALIVASGYLVLSGGNVATQRAFVMVAVMLCAVLVDRRALSLRAVAVAAVIVLFLRPEALLGPGFQMSFAATTALVAVFGVMRDREISMGPKWLSAVFGVVLSSLVAGVATAPIGAAHFNTMAHYGLVANLLSVPLMGVLVIPAAVLAVVLYPLGLDWIGLDLMGLGLVWILGVAEWVTNLPGTQGHIPTPASWVLPVIALGFIWIVLWRGKLKWAGAVAILCAFNGWRSEERPAVLIAGTGGLIGVMTDEGRALSKSKGNGFIAKVWLENDGDGAEQFAAAKRWPEGQGKLRTILYDDAKIIHVTGKRAAQSLTSCSANDLVISAVPLAMDGPCDVYDAKRLLRTGSLALGPKGIVTADSLSGDRLWTQNGK
jgi:competence protein ComEC